MPMVDAGPDDITVARARSGDRIAQAAVLRSVQDRLWRVCRGLLSDHQLAEDAQQEAALRILTHLPGFASRSSFATWATGIAVNVCREQRRRNGRGLRRKQRLRYGPHLTLTPKDGDGQQQAQQEKQAQQGDDRVARDDNSSRPVPPKAFTAEPAATEWAPGAKSGANAAAGLTGAAVAELEAPADTSDYGPDDVGKLHAALSALPDRQREAVVLRYLEGMDVAQTAELMGVARGTVKATVHAGLKRLREVLNDAA